jgi:hypothetical protein
MSRKSMRWKGVGVSKAVILVAFALFWGADAVAQTSPGASYGNVEMVAADALSCWWKSDKSAVRVGEEFTATLTCRLAETGRERTVVNESLLDPSVLALPPYQVKDGRHYKDIIRVLPGPDGPVTFRSVQYTYTVKLMGEGFFGKDLPLPPLEIHYHIDLVTNRDVVTPGKERTYVLSPLPMRIQSLVPKAAIAIRDAGYETFGDIEGRRRSAVVAFMAAGIFLLLPLLVLPPILVRAVHGKRKSVFNGTVFRDKDLSRRLAGELDHVEKHCRTASWDEASIGTVLSVFRVGGALAIGRRVAQMPVTLETYGREGQLELRKGLWPRMKVLISASLTPEEMADELAVTKWQGAAAAERKALLGEAQRAFAVFNNARYTLPGDAAGREALDGALKTGLRLLRALRHDHVPFVRVMRAAREHYTWWRRQWKRA